MTSYYFEVSIALLVSLCFVSISGQSDCRTPNGDDGQCILLQYCPSLYALVRKSPLPASDRRLLLSSQCGQQDRQPKVCCSDVIKPTAPPPVINTRCVSPDNRLGLCIELRSCDLLYNIIKKKPISPEHVTFLQQSKCGMNGKQPLVCCPTEFPDEAPNVTVPIPEVDTGSQMSPTSPLLPSYADCGNPLAPDKITNGEIAELSDFPWMAILHYQLDGNNEFSCGGSIINNRYILTAAHCVKGRVLQDLGNLLSVRVGEFDTMNETDCTIREGCSPPPQDIAVEETMAHPNWRQSNRSQVNDIGLVRLSRPIVYNNFVRPICLPNKGVEIAGRSLSISGWGITENNDTSTKKLKAIVPLQPLSVCQTRYQTILQRVRETISLDETSQFCAGGVDGKDSCQGDSGGPAMSLHVDEDERFVWFNTGIVSFGPTPCGIQGIPGVYTRVNAHVNWIVSNLRP